MLRRLVSAAALLGAAAALASCASGPTVEPTGHTTTVTVEAMGMTFTPDTIEVPVGDRLVIEFENADMQVHDLTVENGVASTRLAAGGTETLDVGIIGEDLDFWCSVPGHREMGMEGTIVAVE